MCRPAPASSWTRIRRRSSRKRETRRARCCAHSNWRNRDSRTSRFRVKRMVLVLDNYDSFTYNLVQYLGELGAEVTVVRNDATTVDAVTSLQPGRIVISPGPGRP